MRRRMPDDLETLGVLVGHDAQPRVVVDEGGGIHQDSVELAGERRLGKARTNARGDVRDGNRAIELSVTSVRKSNYGHRNILSKRIPHCRPSGPAALLESGAR